MLKPGFASGLVILRLLAGSVEPIVELPMMPGETSDELLIAVDPKPLTVALEAQLDSLRDEVVDLVALRARSEARMKARLEGEDWAGLEAELKEFARLTPREQFVAAAGTAQGRRRPPQAELKTAILTKTAQAQITELQSMIDRYLDDDAFRAYSEALDKGQVGAGGQRRKHRPRRRRPPRRAVPIRRAQRRQEHGTRPATAKPAARPVHRRPAVGVQGKGTARDSPTFRIDSRLDAAAPTACVRADTLRAVGAQPA